MSGFRDFLDAHTPEESRRLLSLACAVAGKKKHCSIVDIQNHLRITYEEAVLVHDLLSDKYLIDAQVTYHWVRCARRYARNNPTPTLAGMLRALGVGERRGYLLMIELAKRNIIRIKGDRSFEHAKRMATFGELVAQMRVVAKKYQNRCEPELLVRTLYVDDVTALRLAQYGEEYLDMTWKRKG